MAELGDIWEMGKRDVPVFRQVYFIEAVELGLVKIGCANDARSRLRDLQIGSPAPLTLKGVYHTDDAQRLEASYHQRYDALRVHGEWFKIDDDLRELIDDAFGPDENHVRICFHPKPGAGATIERHESDTDESFAARAAVVASAMSEAYGDVYGAVMVG